MTMESTKLRNILEGALLAAGQPLNLNRLKSLFEEDEQPEKEDILAALEGIATDCEGRGFELKEVGSGWRFQVRNEVAPWINRLWEEKPQKYSRALLETLALVAYRQPITRGDIEEIRGVAVSSHIIKTLTEREWVKVVGHRDVPGRPSLYATTRQFLDYFNLKSLDELPSLGEIRDLNDLNKVLDWDETPEPAGAEQNNDTEDDSENGAQQELEDTTETDTVQDTSVENPNSQDSADQESEAQAFDVQGLEAQGPDVQSLDFEDAGNQEFDAQNAGDREEASHPADEDADEEGEHGDVGNSDSVDAEIDQTAPNSPDDESVEVSDETGDAQDADTEPTTNEGGSKSLFEDSDNESETSSAHNHESNTDADKSSL